MAALARAAGLHPEQTWRIVTGLRCPSLRTALVLSRGLRIDLQAVATAWEQARERELRRTDAKRALLEALLR